MGLLIFSPHPPCRAPSPTHAGEGKSKATSELKYARVPRFREDDIFQIPGAKNQTWLITNDFSSLRTHSTCKLVWGTKYFLKGFEKCSTAYVHLFFLFLVMFMHSGLMFVLMIRYQVSHRSETAWVLGNRAEQVI